MTPSRDGRTAAAPRAAARGAGKRLNRTPSLERRFQRPWSGDVPSGESANPGGRSMAEEPKAPEPEPSIAGEEETKPPARPRNLYGYVKKAWKNPHAGVVEETHWQRLVDWRHGPAIGRIERPTRIDRARELGYRAKQGYILVRARVRRGGRRKPHPMGGRKAKRRGLRKITMAKSIQRIAEGRGARRVPHPEILHSYWGGGGGAPGLPWPDIRGEEGPRPPAQRQGRGEGSPEHRGPRAQGQVTAVTRRESAAPTLRPPRPPSPLRAPKQ